MDTALPTEQAEAPPFYRLDNRLSLRQGDCRTVLPRYPDGFFDSVVTDPPYGLSKEPNVVEVMRHWLDGTPYSHTGGGFMGKTWDSFVPGPEYWREVFRVLKPGGHALVMAGTRTVDLMMIALRFAGFEIRDSLTWIYGSGFPKSHDVSKAIDKMAGAEREVIGVKDSGPLGGRKDGSVAGTGQFRDDAWSSSPVNYETAPATDDAKRWAGWGTALKPAHEPIIVARKPLGESTVASNVLRHGTGAMNVDRCRVGTDGATKRSHQAEYDRNEDGSEDRSQNWARTGHGIVELNAGRWPANVIHDGSDEVMEAFADFGEKRAGVAVGRNASAGSVYGGGKGLISQPKGSECLGYAGTAARFFYCAKASTSERNTGCSGKNSHPTVKPLALIRYLVRLVTPPDGLVLDPFVGSGTTAVACLLEGFRCVGIDNDQTYLEMARDRCIHHAGAAGAAGAA